MGEHDLDWRQVADRETFLAFVRALLADWVDSRAQEATNPSNPWGPTANGWYNVTIEGFLEAALAWAEDSHTGQSLDLDGEASWKTFAPLLYAGKIYE